MIGIPLVLLVAIVGGAALAGAVIYLIMSRKDKNG